MMITTRGFRMRGCGTGARLLSWALVATAAACNVGCGGTSKPIVKPTPIPAASTFNNYVGTQGAQLATKGQQTLPQAGLVTLSINDTGKTFNWQNTTNGSYAIPGILGGTFTPANGFLDLTTVSFGGVLPLYGANPGLALEIPTRAALLRAGDNTTPPSFLVPSIGNASATCQPVTTATTFQFVTLPDPFHSIVAKPPFAEAQSGPAYGSLVVSSKNGNYNFSNYVDSYLNGESTNPVHLQNGLCAQTAAGALVTIPADNTNNIPPTSMAIGPTGFLMLDQTLYQTQGSAGIVYGQPSGIGVSQPSSALDTGSMASAKYLGFKFEPAQELNENPGQAVTFPLTEPVGFGLTAGPSGGIVGGIFSNDDVTTTPLSDTTITFGPQSASKNGLFLSAGVTVPDPNGACPASGHGTVGTDAGGNPTCSFPAVIVAGNPEGKLALFLIANDFANGSTMGIYLFQQ